VVAISASIIVFYPGCKAHIVCDAPDVAIGAMLEQYNLIDKGWHPVEFLGKVFNPTELNCTGTDREFMGLVLALVT
jgi:hypothetical protein